MAKGNIAQDEQILKSLEYSLEEISNQHQLIHDSLAKLQAHYHEAWNNVNQSWSKVVNLFLIVDQLKSPQSEIEKNEH